MYRIEKALHMLKLHFFGDDHAGKNAFFRLQRQMRRLRVNLKDGILKWRERMEDFQAYLPHMP